MPLSAVCLQKNQCICIPHFFFWDILFIMVWKSSISPQLISNLCAIDLSAHAERERKLRLGTRSTSSSKSHSNYYNLSPKTNPHKCIEHTQLTQELVEKKKKNKKENDKLR